MPNVERQAKVKPVHVPAQQEGRTRRWHRKPPRVFVGGFELQRDFELRKGVANSTETVNLPLPQCFVVDLIWNERERG